MENIKGYYPGEIAKNRDATEKELEDILKSGKKVGPIEKIKTIMQFVQINREYLGDLYVYEANENVKKLKEDYLDKLKDDTEIDQDFISSINEYLEQNPVVLRS